jgi:hypothetical protein
MKTKVAVFVSVYMLICLYVYMIISLNGLYVYLVSLTKLCIYFKSPFEQILQVDKVQAGGIT